MNRWYIAVVFLIFITSCSNQSKTVITNVNHIDNDGVRLVSKDFIADIFESTSDDTCDVDAKVTFLDKKIISKTVIGISSYMHNYISHLKNDYDIDADYTYKFSVDGLDIKIIGNRDMCNIIRKEWMHA
jgi:hypothetical protein